MATPAGLDYMRLRTVVDCDTVDEESKYFNVLDHLIAN